MEIKYIEQTQMLNNLIELCGKVALTYGLQEPDAQFCAHLAAILKKYYSHLTFEQLDMAFESNSMGLLNEYLPKNGFNIDNKVKFTIPDTTKIIKAYTRYKKLDEQNKTAGQEPENKVKDANIQSWCNSFEQIFNTYANQFKHSPITVPTFTCEVLSKVGLLDAKKIDYTEQTINIGFKHASKSKRLHNIDLIYAVFDEVLDRGEHIKKYLDKFRYKYADNYQIPDFD